MPKIEILESRIAPATVVVTSLADSGTGSLRAAIAAVDGGTGGDTITFQNGTHALHGTIILKSVLPSITESVTKVDNAKRQSSL